MKNNFDGNETGLMEEKSMEQKKEIILETKSKLTMSGSYPCSKCSCSDYRHQPLNSIMCVCGHESGAHGLP